MKTISEITEMRKDGDSEGAYIECKKQLESNATDRDARVEMAMCIKDLMDKASSVSDIEGLAALLGEFGALRLEEAGEGAMNYKAIWPVRSLLLARKDAGTLEFSDLDTLWQALAAIEFEKPHRYYSILLECFLRVKDLGGASWPGLVDMVDHWGLENLLPEDYKRTLQTNGMRLPSLAERAYSGYVKSILVDVAAGRHLKEAEAFVYEMDLLAESHPEFQNTLYYKTLLCKSLGKTEEALSTARAFVKNRRNDFWAWSMLADIVDDEDLKLSCYCRAMLCKTDSVFLVKVRQKLGLMMYQRGEYSNARKEFDEIMAVHSRKGWRNPTVVDEMARQPWYGMTIPEYSNTRYYTAHLGETEAFMMGDTPETPVIVTRFNPQKQIVNFITDDRRRGYFSIKKLRERFVDNGIYKVRFAEEFDEKTAAKVATCRRVEDITDFEDIFWRRLEAEVSIRPGQSFTFVEGVYVDGSLLNGIEPGTYCEITAVLYFNIKHETWGWRAVRVVPAE